MFQNQNEAQVQWTGLTRCCKPMFKSCHKFCVGADLMMGSIFLHMSIEMLRELQLATCFQMQQLHMQ